MAEKETASPSREGTARWAVIPLCGVQFVDVLGVTAAIAAIPAIIRGLSAPPEATGLLATVYAAFFGGLLVLGARLGDKYGPRRVLLIGLVLFTAVAFLAATAHEIVQLLAAIALEGAAAALSVPCALRLLLHVAADPESRRAGLAAWSATGAVDVNYDSTSPTNPPVGFGATAKMLVASGAVSVDGVVELRKTCKIRDGQVVRVGDAEIRVTAIQPVA